MSHTTYTLNRYHLGDNLIFLHLLRILAKQRVSQPFVHFCHAHLIPQLQEAVADLPNILLEPFESRLWEDRGPQAVDTWKNAGATDTRRGESANYQQGFWERSKNRWDWSAFTLEHHAWTANRLGFESPFTCREHLLFDAPCINENKPGDGYDFLIGNAEPCSGQLKPMAQHGSGYMQPLIDVLRKNWSVITTEECKQEGMSVAQIGGLSESCDHHVMTASGPFWMTMNTYNHHHHEWRRRIVLLDNGEVLGMPHIEQVPNVESVFTIAKEAGWI